jgi:hypothetical protein
MIRQCSSCGAQNVVRNEWQGGDPKCTHYYYDVVPSSFLESEIRALFAKYSHNKVVAAVNQVYGELK